MRRAGLVLSILSLAGFAVACDSERERQQRGTENNDQVVTKPQGQITPTTSTPEVRLPTTTSTAP